MIKAAKGRLLLHLCCAPCGTVGWTDLLAEGWDVTAFFWGANIHPYGEWAVSYTHLTLPTILLV